MRAAQLCGGKASTAFTNTRKRWSLTRKLACLRSSRNCSTSSVAIQKNEDVINYSRLCANRRTSPEAVVRCRKPFQNVCQASSDCSIEPCDVEEPHDLVKGSNAGKEIGVNGVSEPTSKSLGELQSSTGRSPSSPIQSQSHDVKHELIMLSLPAIASQAIDPMAQLMETAYIGRLGPVQLAAAGVSISIFNIISKLFNMPLLSVATSFVAEDIAKSSALHNIAAEGENTDAKSHHGEHERKQLSSVSTALLLALGIGIIEASALLLGSGPFLSLMGVSIDSPMRGPAQRFLALRALGAPAFVLSLALQGILRGFKDTKTPVFCLGVANVTAIFLFPLFINILQMGVSGAALATVTSQYIGSFLMLWFLSKRVVLLPPRLAELKFGVYLKTGGFLIGRTMAVLITMTIGTSMAARQGPLAMAAHQICLQVWLAVSLLTDALAASAQALVATSLSRGDYDTVKELTNFVLKIGIYTGVTLAMILGLSFGSLANFFTKDAEVLRIVMAGTLFVSASQPLNSLAFIFDGLHYGASDFRYAAYFMMVAGVISSAFLLYAPTVIGLPGIWLGLSLFMGLRVAAGYFRILSKNGPWWFLHTGSRKLTSIDQLGSN